MSQTTNTTNITTPTSPNPSTQLLTELYTTLATNPTTNATPATTPATPNTTTPNTLTYSMRNRASINPPTAFPVSFAPHRHRTTNRVARGYNNTANVKMPVKTKRDGVTKNRTEALTVKAGEQAATRADRAAARELAREKRRVGMEGERKEGVVYEDEDCEMEGVEIIV